MESVVRDLPCPISMHAIAQLSGRIPVRQYASSEQQAAALQQVLIDGIHVKSCRASRPAGKWQNTYHSVVVQTTSYTPEYGNRALTGIVTLHKSRLLGAQETRLENPPAQPDPSDAVVVTGRFTRSGGEVDNIHLYHFVLGNTVNWILLQAVAPELPLTTVPDPESWLFVQSMFARLEELAR